MRLQLLDRPGREIGAGQYAEPLHLGGCYRAYSMESFHWQCRDEIRAFVRRDDAKPIGLVLIARKLGDELAVTHAGGRSQSRLRLDPRSNFLRYRPCSAQPTPVLGDVEIGFVEA